MFLEMEGKLRKDLNFEKDFEKILQKGKAISAFKASSF